jgi:Tfp pilus assembly protein PilW
MYHEIKNKNLKTHCGFTLVELLLYVAISGTVLLAAPVFLSSLFESRIKNQTMAEIDGQGLQIMQMITQTIRNASAINVPAISANATSLSLNTPISGNNPTVFDAGNGAIRIKEGAGAAIPLTNSRVIVSGLIFSNLSRAGTKGTIRIQFTLSSVNTTGRYENTYAKNFTGSATVR